MNKTEDINALKFQVAIDSYLNNCRANEMSDGTIENYAKVLKHFTDSMKTHGHTEPTIAAASDWKNDMYEREFKITTLASYMGIAHTFFDWAVEMEMLEKNIFVPAIMPSKKAVSKAKKQPYKALLTENEFLRILHGKKPSNSPEKIWKRNRAILITFLTTAIRNSELRLLKLDNLDFENSTITIEHGKGDKFRVVAFPKIAQEAILDYLKSGCRPKELSSSDILFGTMSNGHPWHEFDRHDLSKLVERNISLLTGRTGVRSHALRHACASIMYDKGMSLDEISSLLGHESVSTTEIYAERLRPALPSNHANDLFEKITNPQIHIEVG